MGTKKGSEWERVKEMRSFLREQGAENDFRAMPYFRGATIKDRLGIIYVHRIMRGQGEISSDPREIERVARLYYDQHESFKEAIQKNGFEPVKDVMRDYDGRIALLTSFGTFTIFGKYKPEGRFINMTRIHSPKMNYDRMRGQLDSNLALGEKADVIINSNGGYHSSALRGLAINPRGADGDELEEKEAIRLSTIVHENTWIRFPNELEYAG